MKCGAIHPSHLLFILCRADKITVRNTLSFRNGCWFSSLFLVSHFQRKHNKQKRDESWASGSIISIKFHLFFQFHPPMPKRETAMCAVPRKFAHFSIRLPGKKGKANQQASERKCGNNAEFGFPPRKKINFFADIIEIILQLKSQAKIHTQNAHKRNAGRFVSPKKTRIFCASFAWLQ
jgi:hypothetical protein